MTWLEIWETIKNIIIWIFENSISLLKSWSFIILVITFIFRKNIKDFIDEHCIKSIKTKNSEAQFERTRHKSELEKTGLMQKEENEQKQDTKELYQTDNETSKPIPDLPNNDYKPVIEEQENKIKEYIEKLVYEEKSVLIRELASTQLAFLFEQIYWAIFGSQLRLLKLLKEKYRSIKKIRQIYNEVSEKHESEYKNLSFEQWYNFLATHRLVEKKSQRYYLTDTGKAFLLHITEKGYNLNKTL